MFVEENNNKIRPNFYCTKAAINLHNICMESVFAEKNATRRIHNKQIFMIYFALLYKNENILENHRYEINISMVSLCLLFQIEY